MKEILNLRQAYTYDTLLKDLIPIIDELNNPKSLVEVLKNQSYTGYVYVLLLEDNKYYVGYTNDPPGRILQHLEWKGSIATKQFRPCALVLLRKGTLDIEQLIVKELVNKYGKDNVRGGYCTSQFKSRRKAVYG